jgi:zinc transport system substrate-binding protein
MFLMNKYVSKKRNLLCSVFIMMIMLFISAGCSGDLDVDGQGSDDRISVCASFYTMYDFAEKIGGDRIRLTNIIPVVTEPHHWEPSPKDILAIEKADVFIYNGAGMEPWVEKVLGSIRNEDIEVVETSKGIELLKGEHSHDEENEDGEESIEAEDHDSAEYDPHVWLDPLMAKKQMEAIKDALVRVDPANGDYYKKNFDDNAKKLDELDREYKEALSKYAKKDIVVGHKAFGYLCKAYGLRQNAVEGLNSEFEPTPAKMAEIVRFIRDNDIKVIFTDGMSNSKVANTVAGEVGARILVLNPLGGLTDEDIKSGKDYFSVMRENLEALKKALE